MKGSIFSWFPCPCVGILLAITFFLYEEIYVDLEATWNFITKYKWGSLFKRSILLIQCASACWTVFRKPRNVDVRVHPIIRPFSFPHPGFFVIFSIVRWPLQNSRVDD